MLFPKKHLAVTTAEPIPLKYVLPEIGGLKMVLGTNSREILDRIAES